MSIFAKDFTFNGTSLSEKNDYYALVSFDSDFNTSTIFSRSISKGKLTYDRVITNNYAALDSDVIKFDLTICKACEEAGKGFTQNEVRELIGWLTSPTEPKELYFTGIDGDEVYVNAHYFGRFVKGEYVEQGNADKQAVTFYFENTSAYAFTKEYEYEIISTNSSNGVLEIVNTGSSVSIPIVPRILIAPTETGIVTINNTNDSSMEAFSLNVTTGKNIIIENNNLFNEDGSLMDYSQCNNLNMPILLDGSNTISVTGAAVVTIKARYLINLGI